MRKAIINMGQCLLALVVISLNSCRWPVPDSGSGTNMVENSGGVHFEIIEIDGCEYVTYAVGTQLGLITHKGDCHNPIHKR